MSKRFFLAIFIYPLNLFAQQKDTNTFLFKNDTLKSKLFYCDNLAPIKFYRLLNLIVDSNYLLIDSVKTDLNLDKIYDFILVFSTRIQETELEINACNRKYDKRLLIILLSNGHKYEIPVINENVILSTFEYQSDPYRKISSVKNGFKLQYYLGTRIRYYYDFYFKIDGKKDFFLYGVKSENYDIHISDSNKSYERNYTKTANTNLRTINIRKFIKYY